ncbi:MAG TPA: hypothetical protein VLW65_20635 [Bryobacteraceae bacterium]|nr:hypothetical protein [Bryobacteraceae bacterium]
MRKKLLIAAFATMPIAVSPAQSLQKNRNQAEIGPQLPCGSETVSNGSFEEGNFVPNTAARFMTLPSGATDLRSWTIFSIGKPPSLPANQLLWFDNNNTAGVRSPFSDHFIDLTGITDAVPLSLSQQITLESGRYLLQLAVGWDRPRNPSGIVMVDWALTPAGQTGSIPYNTVKTDGTSANNWQLLHDTAIATNGGPMVLQFEAHPGQTVNGSPLQFIGLDNVSLKKLFPPDSRACLEGKKLPPLVK